MNEDERSALSQPPKQLSQKFRPAKSDGVGVAAVQKSGLSEVLVRLDRGNFGTTVTNLLILENLAAAFDLGVEAYTLLTEKISKPQGQGSIALVPLTQEENRLAGFFLLRVFCHVAAAAMSALSEVPEVEGALSEDGMESLAEMDASELTMRIARLLAEFVRRETQRPAAESLGAGERAASAVHVFLLLLGRAESGLSSRGRIGQMQQLLDKQSFQIGETAWAGFRPLSAKQEAGSLLRPVTAADIVGNRAYLEAGFRLARDVAGYDFEKRKNPKLINPILFALGRPGCGKTLAAHAVGNGFLSYCKERGVPAKFVVIRKSDWASSYQNASASNLIRIFKDLHRFEGVTGVYWADIDTALASRDQAGLRSEEKANLSAAFNIFDGTLIPFDGKWFMICDANNLAMDEALRTRIAQNPFHVQGPECPEDYVRLLRDILLRDFAPYLKVPEADWSALGELACKGDISGRGMEGISRQIIDRIQDFSYPDEYYSADYEGRMKIIQKFSKTVESVTIREVMERYIAFEKDEEERRAQERFDTAVKDAVFDLNVRKEVVEKIAGEIADEDGSL